MRKNRIIIDNLLLAKPLSAPIALQMSDMLCDPSTPYSEERFIVNLMRLTPLKVHLILVLFFVVVLIGADTVEVVLGLGGGVGLFVVVFFVVKTVNGVVEVDGSGRDVVGVGLDLLVF